MRVCLSQMVLSLSSSTQKYMTSYLQLYGYTKILRAGAGSLTFFSLLVNFIVSYLLTFKVFTNVNETFLFVFCNVLALFSSCFLWVLSLSDHFISFLLHTLIHMYFHSFLTTAVFISEKLYTALFKGLMNGFPARPYSFTTAVDLLQETFCAWVSIGVDAEVMTYPETYL